MIIRIKAPEGYKLLDTKTRQEHSEVITDEKNKGRFTLVPATDKPTTEIIGG